MARTCTAGWIRITPINTKEPKFESKEGKTSRSKHITVCIPPGVRRSNCYRSLCQPSQLFLHSMLIKLKSLNHSSLRLTPPTYYCMRYQCDSAKAQKCETKSGVPTSVVHYVQYLSNIWLQAPAAIKPKYTIWITAPANYLHIDHFLNEWQIVQPQHNKTLLRALWWHLPYFSGTSSLHSLILTWSDRWRRLSRVWDPCCWSI